MGRSGWRRSEPLVQSSLTAGRALIPRSKVATSSHPTICALTHSKQSAKSARPRSKASAASRTAGADSRTTVACDDNDRSALTMSVRSRLYALASVHTNSTKTVSLTQIDFCCASARSNGRRALAACEGSSPTSKRSRTLMSTAIAAGALRAHARLRRPQHPFLPTNAPARRAWPASRTVRPSPWQAPAHSRSRRPQHETLDGSQGGYPADHARLWAT